MMSHLAVDTQSGLVQKVIGTAANVSDISQTHELLHGQEQDVFDDAGYLGVQKRPEITSRKSQPQWHISAKRGAIRAMPEGGSRAPRSLSRSRRRFEHGWSIPFISSKISLSIKGSLPGIGQNHRTASHPLRFGQLDSFFSKSTQRLLFSPSLTFLK